MKLNTAQVRFLRSQAHSLKPVVMVGANGITDNLLAELDLALDNHELIKVRVRAEERDDRNEIIERLCKASKATKIQRVGHILTLYRANPKQPKYTLPKK